MTASTFRSILTSDWAWPMEDYARRAAALVALVIAAGLWAGDQLHRLNDRLARAYVALLGLSQAAPVCDTTPEPVAAAEVLWKGQPLSTLTVAELRRMARAAGMPRSEVRLARKLQLVAFLGGWAQV